jgi:hypothetical protein
LTRRRKATIMGWGWSVRLVAIGSAVDGQVVVAKRDDLDRGAAAQRRQLAAQPRRRAQARSAQSATLAAA